MQFKKLLAVLCMGLILASGAVFAQNARVAALGIPSTGLTLLIDDVSDILNFPADVITSTDMVQGAVGLGNASAGSFIFVNNSAGYVFASKSLMGNMALGVVFGKPSYLAGSYIPGNAFANTGYVSFNTALANAYTGGGVGGLITNNPGTPGNVGHLLFGMDLGGMALGLDMFREASNSSAHSDNPATNIETDEYSKTGALGAVAGLNMDVGGIEAKLSAGFVLPSHDSKGTSDNGTTTSEATLTKESGFYLPISAKGKMKMGDHKLVAGVDFVMDSYQFKPTNVGVTTNQPEYSNKHIGIGVGDEIALNTNTNFYSSIACILSTSSNVQDPAGNGDVTTTTTGWTLPAISVGIERVIKNFWKTDQIAIRAGGGKAVTWTNTTVEGDETAVADQENSSVATPGAFFWTTGLSVTKGDFDLDMVVDPTRWCGVDFISDTGPVGVNITMTYNFGGGSSSSGGGMDYSTPSYEAPAPMDESTDDVLDF